VLSGCSAVKTGKTRVINTSLISAGDIRETRKNNLSNDDFNVQRADVVLNANGNEQKFIASFKYKLPGIWLISIKSNTGIEAARVWITDDTVLINDRLHKKLYYGKSSILEEKYGIPVKAIPVLIGDFIETDRKIENSIDCREGIDDEVAQFKNFKVEYVISCRESKTLESKIVSPNKNAVQISYSKTKKNNNRKYPTKIILKDPKENVVIEIKIRSIDFNNNEKIEFIPGKGYEKVLLK
jgi:hypothetical protein